MSRASDEGCTDTSSVDVSSVGSRTAASGSRSVVESKTVGGASTGRRGVGTGTGMTAEATVANTGKGARAGTKLRSGSVTLAVVSVETVEPSDEISSKSGSSSSLSESAVNAESRKSKGPS